MRPPSRSNVARDLVVCAAAVLVLLALDSAHSALMAQNPFGGPRAGGTEPQIGGIVGWILAKQSEFYREMSATIRAAKSDGSAVWTLLTISFAYGIFHAAGPGHGKAVISSYLVANQETARRGIALSFASALMQALVAVVIVAVCAWLLNATAKTMCGAEKAIEIASYALIAAFGIRLVWTKGGGFFRALQAPRAAPAMALAGHHDSSSLPPPLRGRAGEGGSHEYDAQVRGHDHDRHHDHSSLPPPLWGRVGERGGHEHNPHDHAHSHTALAHDHAHAHDDPAHVHDEHCGHSHGPEPSELAGSGGWRRGFGAIFAVGIRPCSGAILVLVFALAQGLFWAGIAATFVIGLGTAITVATIAVLAVSAKDLARRLSSGREGSGALVMRGIEFSAAGLVLLFGIGLLVGYIAAERVTCF